MPDAIRTMFAGDVISAKLASAYVTISGNRYLLFQAKSLNATIEKDKKEVPPSGPRGAARCGFIRTRRCLTI